MASTVTATTLTSTITESITLNGNTYGNTVTHTVTTQGQAYSRTMAIRTSETGIIDMNTADATGTVIGDSVSYMRFTNLDDTNYIQLTFKTEAENFSVRLNAGESYVCMNNQMDAVNSTTQGALEDCTEVTAKANTLACDLEFIIVSS